MPAKSKSKKSTKSTKTKSTSKSTKPSPAKSKTVKETTKPESTSMPMTNKPSRKNLVILLVIIAVGLLTYKLGPWLFPATINNRPITRFELYNRLESLYGEQVLEDMVNNKILDQAISDANVQVDEARIEEQFNALEQQFEQLGGLDTALEQQGLNREELRKQLYTQLAIEEILKDKIQPTEEEITSDYEAGLETIYADKSLDEVRSQIEESIRQDKLRQEFLNWFQEVKENYNVKRFDL